MKVKVKHGNVFYLEVLEKKVDKTKIEEFIRKNNINVNTKSRKSYPRIPGNAISKLANPDQKFLKELPLLATNNYGSAIPPIIRNNLPTDPEILLLPN